jgi:DNA-binding transcriptional ArsR family regulator
MSTTKHPLVAAVEAILPEREARLDVMRAYDDGVRASIKALEGALGGTLGQGMSFGWVVRQVTKEGGVTRHLYVGDGTEWSDEKIGRAWTNIRSDAEIFPTDFMVTVMETLTVMFPNRVFEARELFTAI